MRHGQGVAAFLGYWKITSMEVWDRAFIDLVVPGHITFELEETHLIGGFQFGAVVGWMDCRVSRGSGFPQVEWIEANWLDSATDGENVRWARDPFAQMQRFSSGGMYLNVPGFAEEGDSVLRVSHGRSYEKLQQLKATFDPENVFRSNFNISPAIAV